MTQERFRVEFKPPRRILMGPGPSNVPTRVLQAMSLPVIGHLDPDFLGLMNRIQNQLRELFRTSNRLTIPVSGTGSAGMEASVLNFVEEGDPVLVCVNGVFGIRLAEVARRAGARCTTVSFPFGRPLDPDAVREAALRDGPRLIAMVHAETSTGVLQSIRPIREICDEVGALLLVDTVTSLGGHPVLVDDERIDICYSGTQKCLSCPPGLSPLTVSRKAEEKLSSRTQPCRSWYLDLNLVRNYWGEQRTYHHTAPISMNYALFEALRIIEEEGLEARWNRHRLNHEALVAGLEAMGLKLAVSPECRLWSLNALTIPEGVDDLAVRQQLLSQFNLEIGGGLGELKGKIWRVGLMGETSRAENVLYFLHAQEACLQQQGFATPAWGAGLVA
ncbi:MAG: alanine--glyoxylate aminotransferase family protein, partial [Acidobacteriota bacterium]